MTANERHGPGEAGTGEAGTGKAATPSDDVGAILDDLDEALEEDPEEVVRSFRQEGGQ
jgi:ubiquitin-like protein Pup